MSGRRCRPRSRSTVDTRVAGRRSATAWSTVSYTPTRPRPRTASGSATSSPTRSTPRSSSRIFEEFLAGDSVHAIARQLTADNIPCPSAADPKRNRHRLQNGPAWAHTAVRAILSNPRYTGFQVWNRQRRHEILIDVHDVAAGHETRMRWNDRDDWVWSSHPTQVALVSLDQWNAAQDLLRASEQATTRTPKEGRQYVLAGMIRCGTCRRRMEGVWNHGRPYYRCQVHRDSSIDRTEHPATIYVREDSVVPGLDAWIAELFEPDNLDRHLRRAGGCDGAGPRGASPP